LLRRLTIRDFGIIEDLDWFPSTGLNVLTGETGAGKSLVLDALDAIMGRRVGQEVVRAGAQSAVIEVEVTPPSGGNSKDVCPAAVPETVLLTRYVGRSGRGGASVDGSTVPIRTLGDIAARVFDLHGPNQQFSLLNVREQLALLDDFGSTAGLRSEFASQVARLRGIRKDLESSLTDERELARRRDILAFEAGEIRSAGLVPGEDADLEEEMTLLANVEQLRSAVATAADQIYGGEQGLPSGSDRIGEGLRWLREVAHLDRRLVDIAQAVEGALYQVEDAGRELASYRDSLEYDPVRHEQIRARLEVIRMMKKKYGPTIESVLVYAQQAEQEMATLDSSEERRGQLEREEGRLREELAAVGAKLSEARQEAASSLSRAVEAELSDLNMEQTGFMVSFALIEGDDDLVLPDGASCGFASDGIDDVEFLIRPNPGEPFMSLSRTASTGETSRLMLALRCALSREGAVPTLVFDEIDIGIGGRSGEIVGRKLALLSQRHQVICITHLPQVAAYGDSHYSVRKIVSGERTFVAVDPLEGEARQSELSSMLGSLGEPSLSGAQELLNRADSWKRGLSDC